MVAYASTEEAPEGQNAKYMTALNCTVASVPAREYIFGRDMLDEKGKLLLAFAEDNKLALLNTLFCTPKSGVSYTFQSANCSKGQARLDYILTKQADRRLIRCVNVRRPPVEAPKSDHNLVCDWGGRGYDDFVSGEVIKTAPSGDETT